MKTLCTQYTSPAFDSKSTSQGVRVPNLLCSTHTSNNKSNIVLIEFVMFANELYIFVLSFTTPSPVQHVGKERKLSLVVIPILFI